jgi:MFS family permease
MTAYYLSSLLAFTGGHMINYTVIMYLQDKLGSDLLSGIGFGLSFGSSIVFGWFAGVLCDRVSPLRVVHGAHALFVLSLAVLWWTDWGGGQWQVVGTLVSAFLGGLAWSFLGPARLAALGHMVPAEKLKPASILFNLQVLIGFGLAPVLIGLVRSHHGWPAVFALGMGLFVLSSLLLWGMKTRGSVQSSRGVLAEVMEGFGAVGANPLLLQLVLAAVIALAMTGPMQILLPKLAKEVLGLSELQRYLVTIWKVPGALSIRLKKRTRSILLPSTLRSSLSRVSFTPAVPAIILMKIGLVSVRVALALASGGAFLKCSTAFSIHST